MDTEHLRFDAITRAMAHLGVSARFDEITALAAIIVDFVKQPVAVETGGKKWTPERKALLRELYLSGTNATEIAFQLNALPGPRVTGMSLRGYATNHLMLRRSVGTPVQLANVAKMAAARKAKRVA